MAATIEDMEIISIGPAMENVHTPRERVHVPSLEKISVFLTALVQDL
jgi:dipeptidase D